ncbi:MAG TPA: PQQ-binding-like beta-propeller repeat protein [Vicinamibacterales bacterium]|nr:PQQ-binding-like beta-propeller repeat protein [Vicinamibacterales bacterium]
MRIATAVLTLVLASAGHLLSQGGGEVRMLSVTGEGAKYWPRWRGPSGQGYVAPGKYANTWSPTRNVKWRVPVAGAGNSSPIVWADRIFLTTAQNDGARLSLIAFHRADGKQLWETVVPSEGIERVHQKNGHASATPVTDGRMIYASFGRHGLVGFDMSGKIVWHRRFGAINNYHGPAGSPVLYNDRVFIYQDHKGSSEQQAFVAAFDAKTGKTIWETPRTETVGWGTPVVINAGTRDELIINSQRRVAAYDPGSGKELWTVRGMTFEVIPTPVVGDGLVFTSSGRAGPTLAIKPGGSGDVTDTHVVWSTPKGSPFVPSGVVHDGLLYLVNDMQSILTVYETRSGDLVYQGRMGVAQREGFSASPVVVNNELYFTNDEGETFVVKAGREFNLMHTNSLGERTLASPALVDGIWYWRTAKHLLAIQ